jgi:hypothetical protein
MGIPLIADGLYTNLGALQGGKTDERPLPFATTPIPTLEKENL